MADPSSRVQGGWSAPGVWRESRSAAKHGRLMRMGGGIRASHAFFHPSGSGPVLFPPSSS